MSEAGETLAAARIQAAGFRALEPFPGRVNLRWLIECTECGEQQRLRPDHKLKPCEHKQRERQQRAAEAAEKQFLDALLAVRTRTLGTKNLRALEAHPGVEGALWWVECKYCGRKWHMREDKLKACPHKGTGDEGAPPSQPKPTPKGSAKVERPAGGEETTT
ncbi:hypothetical protein ACH4ZX_03825 [Streptomyces sp. NPDC020490]|uniref:hypothetical protein n=1 Tax=Streptomyces sp. NPDC020490 TaxID=3365078 RepID=UPI0037B07C44